MHPRMCVVFNNVSKVHQAKKAVLKYGMNKHIEDAKKDSEE